jgi:tripeptide aminopeptidase
MAHLDDAALAQISFDHLEAVVAIDSQSDENSTTIPSTEGQQVLARHVAERFAAYGCAVEQDAHANVIATLPGRGAGVDAPPLALLVHLDTARGTGHPARLHTLPAWDGRPVPLPARPDYRVDTKHYAALAEFVGHTLVHGDGEAPFGLDDKLGLTHLLTLARLLSEDPTLAHPPLLLIGRPDEEIGRMEAVEGLADLLAARGVRSGYTIDGILPFEVNVANFNGARATLTLPRAAPIPLDFPAVERARIRLGGVNTHGATAHAEGHRTAIRFATELLGLLTRTGLHVFCERFESDPVRDCDGVLQLLVLPSDRAAVEIALTTLVEPHLPRGASYEVTFEPLLEAPRVDPTTARLFDLIGRFVATPWGHPLHAEDSSGWQGYSHPYRVRTLEDRVELDIRLRDFDPANLAKRKRDIATFFGAHAEVALQDQYIDMGPRLANRRDLVERALEAGSQIGVEVREAPIRGGTGVDPFLERGTAIANLGTGYFAPESEKELTSLELMARHARWLVALCACWATVR